MTRFGRAALAAMLGLSAAACTNGAAAGDAPTAGGATDQSCDAAPLADLVGRTASTEMGANALKRSGARMMRWLTPGMAVTAEYRHERLNIHLDAANKVTLVACG